MKGLAFLMNPARDVGKGVEGRVERAELRGQMDVRSTVPREGPPMKAESGKALHYDATKIAESRSGHYFLAERFFVNSSGDLHSYF